MSATIYKYPLAMEDEQEILMPMSPVILSVVEQDGELVMYAMVKPYLKQHPIAVFVRGTGHPVTGAEGRFVGTVMAKNGLVWHVFAKCRVRDLDD